jgi:RNA polymerase sigma-70 factor (ECF subfamily)
MDRYAQGDDRAFRTVFAELRPRLFAFLRRLSGSVGAADDLVQETFLRMHRARGSFGRGARAVPWAYAIARNVAIDHFRSSRARAGLEAMVPGETIPEPVAGPEANAEGLTSALETARIVERELGRMTLARREAFVLLRYEGLSVREAAQILGATEGAVKLRAFHAYAAIRDALAAVEPKEGEA